jgi:hypothetical protein
VSPLRLAAQTNAPSAARRLLHWGGRLFGTYEVWIYSYLELCCFPSSRPRCKAERLSLKGALHILRFGRPPLFTIGQINADPSFHFRHRDTVKSQLITPHYSGINMSSSSKKWQLPSKPSFNVKSKPKSNTKTNTSSWKLTRSSTEPTSSVSSKSSKAWRKTKEFFSSLGEPPTAAYEREQAKKKEVKTSGSEAFGAVNYGPYHQGGPFGGRS